MLGGYMGKGLRVNLTSRTSSTFDIPEDWARRFLGGRGFAAKILYDELDPSTEPLSPENKLVVATGPLSGLFLPGSGKLTFACKSPATGGYADSNVGGHLGPEIKYAGYDVIILEGKADAPSVLVIEDDRVSIRDGSRYWGLGAIATEKALKDELGEAFQCAVIGPAGENLVKFACISHDFGRQAGRCGVGAVMGSKNLKAIAVSGTRAIPLARPKEALEKGKEMYLSCFSKPGFYDWTPYGTAGVTEWVNEVGSFPTKNFHTGYFEHHKQINGQALKERILVTDKGCFGCPIPCGKYSRTRWQGREVMVEGPEYETIAMLGGNCCLESIEDVAYANYVCDELGLDTISAGNVVAFAMECYEKGLITKEEVSREIRFGDLDSVVFLLSEIAARSGIGALLAEGVKVAAERIGKGSERFAIHVKGLEVSGYEPRYAPAMLLAYMTADIGAHHNRAWAITYDVAVGRDSLEGKAEKVIELQHIRPLFDALGLCRLQWVEIGFELHHYGEIFPLVTGIDYGWEDLIRASERIWNLTRLFNIKHITGFGRKYDSAPPRFLEEPMPSGPVEGKLTGAKSAEQLLDRYYQLRGWSPDGVPTKQKLAELDLLEEGAAC